MLESHVDGNSFNSGRDKIGSQARGLDGHEGVANVNKAQQSRLDAVGTNERSAGLQDPL
jgi:hypothetical protein